VDEGLDIARGLGLSMEWRLGVVEWLGAFDGGARRGGSAMGFVSVAVVLYLLLVVVLVGV
jgi:hypothetical protein